MSRRTNEVDQLRSEIAALAPAKHLRRYPQELQRKIAEHTSRRLEAGESKLAIAKSLDVSDQALAKFLSAHISGSEENKSARTVRSRRATRALVPIIVKSDEGSARRFSVGDRRMVVRGPSGLLIEGLTIEALAELIVRVSPCSG